MNTFIRNNLNGILGTILFHLLVIAGFMAVELSSVSREEFSDILIDFDLQESPDQPEDLKVPDAKLQESQYWETVLRRNIAVSESDNRPTPDQFKNLNPTEQQELDARLAQILQQARAGILPAPPDNPEISMPDPQSAEKPSPKKEPEPYRGPSNIFYNLTGRQALWLPVPIYKCPDKGIVTVYITVNQLGYVIQAIVRDKPAGFNEECLQEAAVNAALKARFDHSTDFPQRQTGTITFHFQPQDR